MDRTEHEATAQDGTRLSWTSAGAGGPAVVLTDGIGCAGYVWRALEPELARRAARHPLELPRPRPQRARPRTPSG